jgi:hypothetical protein
MRKMGSYCIAYPIQRLREFPKWTENSQNARQENRQVDGKEVTEARELTDDDFLYLQENFVVTDGIFIDENIIFDDVSPEWISFCQNTLGAEMPVDASNRGSEAASATSHAHQ